MEFEFSEKRIVFNRELSYLDKLVIDFTEILSELKIDYVIISGYIAILFGRSRNTEDVDLFIEKMDFNKFELFWNKLIEKDYECINVSNAKEAFEDYLNEKLAIRFAVKGTFEPNFELKFPKTKYNSYSLNHKIEVLINNKSILTSEIELQIAFKLYLSSEKDLEDARHLYNVFKKELNIELLKHHIKELKVEKEAERILWKKDLN